MTVKENEFGDKIGKSDICAGVLFWVGAALLAACACGRIAQEIGKNKVSNAEKAKITQTQHLR